MDGARGRRWALGGEPMLSKLYVVRDTVGTVVDPKDDPANEFLALLLPELDRILAEPAQPRQEAAASPKN